MRLSVSGLVARGPRFPERFTEFLFPVMYRWRRHRWRLQRLPGAGDLRQCLGSPAGSARLLVSSDHGGAGRSAPLRGRCLLPGVLPAGHNPLGSRLLMLCRPTLMLPAFASFYPHRSLQHVLVIRASSGRGGRRCLRLRGRAFAVLRGGITLLPDRRAAYAAADRIRTRTQSQAQFLRCSTPVRDARSYAWAVAVRMLCTRNDRCTESRRCADPRGAGIGLLTPYRQRRSDRSSWARSDGSRRCRPRGLAQGLWMWPSPVYVVRPGDERTTFFRDRSASDQDLLPDSRHFSGTPMHCAKGPVSYVVGDARLTMGQAADRGIRRSADRCLRPRMPFRPHSADCAGRARLPGPS